MYLFTFIFDDHYHVKSVLCVAYVCKSNKDSEHGLTLSCEESTTVCTEGYT